MGISVTTLRNKLAGGGARPSLFYATISLPQSGELGGIRNRLNLGVNDVSFYIKAAQIPESTIASVPINFLGREFKVPSIDRTFADWTVTVINDEDFRIRHLFEAWIEYMSPGKAIFESQSGFGQNSTIYGDMEVHQLKKGGNVVQNTGNPVATDPQFLGSYFFKDAFPINVSAIELSWDTKDAIEEFSVTFAYQYWEKSSTSNNPNSGIQIGSNNPFASNASGVTPANSWANPSAS